MTTFAYNTAVPNAPNDPADDQPEMLINTVSTDAIIGVDHVTFNTPNGGYHTVIHQTSFSDVASNPPSNNPPSVPAAIAQIGQLFTTQLNDGVNVDESLYYLSGGNRLGRLTMNFQPVAGTNGYTYIPGGIILQWGRKTIPAGLPQNVTINYVAEGGIAMPNATFIALVTLHSVGNATDTAQVCAKSRTAAGFVVGYTGSIQYDSFQWLAIGN